MLTEMTWSQFVDWQNYANLDPFGEERADLRSGTIAAVIANVNSGKGGRRYKARDFMPEFSSARKESGDRQPLVDPNKWQSVLRIAKSVFGGKRA